MKKAVSLLLTAASLLSCAALSAISADAAAIKGDLNGDNTISLRDASMAQKIDVGLIMPTEDQIKGGDLNGDGAVTSLDSLIIQKYVCLDESILNQLAPNKAEREKFIARINADRSAKGIEPFVYTDANLEAGNIRANEYIQNPKNKRLDGREFYTVLEDCNLKYNPSVSPQEFVAEDFAYASDIYNTLVENYTGEGKMYTILTSPEYTTICVGSVKISSNSDLYRWVIIAN